CSLRQAIQFAQSGDRIRLQGDIDTTAVHQLSLGTITISKNLTLQGGGRTVTRIDGLNNNGNRILKVDDAEVTIADLTFANAFQERDEVTSSVPLNHNGGGAIYSVDGDLTVNQVSFEGNYSPAYMGAGISVDRGSLGLTDVDFHANHAYYGSALFVRG